MTVQEIREAAKVMEAYANGKKIQYLNDDNEWIDAPNPLFDWDNYVYRIKPGLRYRPFETKEECWNEMLKHQPFGFVKSKVKGYFHLIGLVQWSSELEDVMIILATSEQLARSSRSLFEDFTFADGEPFGIKEELQ